MKDTLETRQLTKRFTLRRDGRIQQVDAVRAVDLRVRPGETVGLVGESGSGKTTLSRMMIGIERPSSGQVIYNGRRIVNRADWRDVRRHVQYVFQDPFTALCPTMRIGDALAEPLKIHRICTRAQGKQRVIEMLDLVGLHSAITGRLPNQLSGGQRQRVNLARALMLEPRILLCDEVVSGLDVSIQAQILQLLIDLQQRLNLGLLFISHDLRVVRYLCDQVLVMHLGDIVEAGAAMDVFDRPTHPYTQTLVAAIPDHSRHLRSLS